MPGRLLEHATALRKAIAGRRIPDKTWLFLVRHRYLRTTARRRCRITPAGALFLASIEGGA